MALTRSEKELVVEGLLVDPDTKDLYEDYIRKDIPFEAWIRSMVEFLTNEEDIVEFENILAACMITDLSDVNGRYEAVEHQTSELDIWKAAEVELDENGEVVKAVNADDDFVDAVKELQEDLAKADKEKVV